VNERLLASPDPRLFGKALLGEMQGLVRYRIGDYLLICEIQDEVITILVLEAGHRREIYR
jgi:mRNA interferase RelE/StbE